MMSPRKATQISDFQCMSRGGGGGNLIYCRGFTYSDNNCCYANVDNYVLATFTYSLSVSDNWDMYITIFRLTLFGDISGER